MQVPLKFRRRVSVAGLSTVFALTTLTPAFAATPSPTGGIQPISVQPPSFIMGDGQTPCDPIRHMGSC